MNCLNHKNKLAEYHCGSCDGYFCSDCIKELKSGRTLAYICLKCKGRCKSLEELRSMEEEQAEISIARDFWGQLKGIFTYPFNGEGPYILFKGTIGFTIATVPFFLMKIVPNVITEAMVWVLTPFVLFFTVACFLKALEGIAVSDKNELPEFPSLFMVEDWFGKTFIFILTAGLCLAPAMIYNISTNNRDFFFWLLLGGGVYFIPMYMLYVALGEKFFSLNPTKALLSILNNFVAYSIIPLFWLILIIIGDFVRQIITIEQYSIFGFIGRWFLFVYFLFVSMRPLGVFFRAYEDRLFGFESREPRGH